MSSPERPKLADDLWLAAHDTPTGKSQLADRPLGIGLGASLLGELLFTGNIAVYDGKVSLGFARVPDDPALSLIAQQLQFEDRAGWGKGLSADKQRGLLLRECIQYLTADDLAQELVTNRMLIAGTIQLKQRRAFFGGVTTRFLPRNTTISGAPVSHIARALQRRTELDHIHLTLAGLILATGLHQQAFPTQNSDDRSELGRQLKNLHPMLRELVRATEQVVGERAILR